MNRVDGQSGASWAARFIQCVACCVMTTVALAQSPDDPHLIYEKRCAGCHEVHAGDFVSEALVERDGDLFGRNSSRNVEAFLSAGHGRLTKEETTVLLAHFSAIAQSGRLFQRNCRMCHDRAVSLARMSLRIENGELYGRYTGRNIREFLAGHGGLTANEVDTMMSTLKRQLR